MSDQGFDLQPPTQCKADPVMPPHAMKGADLALQLIPGAGAQHQATEQVKVAHIIGGFEQLSLQGLQALIQPQHPFAFGRQACTAAAAPASAALYQGAAGQVVEFIDRIPGSFVAHAGSLGGAGDGALLGNVLQEGHALWAAGNVMGQWGR